MDTHLDGRSGIEAGGSWAPQATDWLASGGCLGSATLGTGTPRMPPHMEVEVQAKGQLPVLLYQVHLGKHVDLWCGGWEADAG